VGSRAEKLLSKGQAFEKKGKPDKALEVYRDGCRQEPYDPDLWLARAAVARKQNLDGEAAESLFKCCDLYARAGLPGDALRVAKQVLELDKGHGGAKRMVRMLETRLGLGEDEPAPAAPTAPTPTPTPTSTTVSPVAPVHERVTAPIQKVEPPKERAESSNDATVIQIEADEPEPMEVFRLPQPPPKSGTPPAATGVVAEFSMGATTTETALEHISLVEKLPVAPTGTDTPPDIPLEDENARLQVVQAVVSTVSSSPLLSELDSDLVKLLIECGHLVHRPGGADIFKEGDIGTSLFLMLNGEVAVLKGEQELARLRPGAFFGEMALLTNTPRTATVRALKDVAALEVSRKDVRTLIDRDPRVLKLIMRFFRARLVGTLLQTSPLFKPLSRDERKQLITRFRLREVGADFPVIKEATTAEGLFVVLVGRLEVVQAFSAGSKSNVLLGSLGPGDVFGEMSLLDGSAAMATVRSRARSWVLLLPRADFLPLVETHPHMRSYLAELAQARKQRNAATRAGKPSVREDRLEPV
jgi:CRP-like cAMP-binding protein